VRGHHDQRAGAGEGKEAGLVSHLYGGGIHITRDGQGGEEEAAKKMAREKGRRQRIE
jgi:hypothetical protein